MNGENKKFFDLLTMCRRAGRTALGFDASKEAVLKKKAALVLLASDISAKTEKEIKFFAEKTGTPVIRTDISLDEFEAGLGKRTGCIGICDKGFAARLRELPGGTGAAYPQ